MMPILVRPERRDKSDSLSSVREEESEDTHHRDDSGVEISQEPSARDGFRIILVHSSEATVPEVHAYKPSKEPVIVGRGGLDKFRFLRLGDSSLSKKHFQVLTLHGDVVLADLESRNGTFVNGRRVSPRTDVMLSDGDVIRCGESLMVVRFGKENDPVPSDSVLPGIAPGIARVRQRLRDAASLGGPLLIVGETGTGKEYAARKFHELRGLPAEGFIPLNCAQLDSLARSELFGVEKGAYTDAQASRTGLVAAAENGALFFDEIGELDLEAQAGLLHLLGDRTYRAVGSTKLVETNAQLIAATNVDLDEAVARGAFRLDLLARLRKAHQALVLPPIRERREDILAWFGRFVREAAAETNRAVPRFNAGAAESLLLYDWPENLRELRMTAAHALLALGTGDVINAAALPEKIAVVRAQARKEELLVLPLAPAPETSRTQLHDALRKTNGVVRRAADLLGIDRRKIYRLCEKYEVDPDSFRPKE